MFSKMPFTPRGIKAAFEAKKINLDALFEGQSQSFKCELTTMQMNTAMFGKALRRFQPATRARRESSFRAAAKRTISHFKGPIQVKQGQAHVRFLH
jgi:polyhydroxyalkanoate synthesis regulator protein